MSKKKKNLIDKLGDMEWKLIKINGESCDHLISRNGLIKRCAGYENTKRGPVYHPEKLIEPYVGKDGNLQVTLRFQGQVSTRYLHILIANAFIPNPKHLINVRHINGNKLDNRIENLEWCSPMGLSAEQVEINRKKRYKNKFDRFKYTEDDIREVCSLLEENKLRNSEISKITGVRPQMVSTLRRKAAWPSIVNQYNIPELKENNGSNHHNSRYTDEQIHEVCRLLKEDKLTYPMISEKTNVGVDMICRISRGKNWKHISKQYGLIKE